MIERIYLEVNTRETQNGNNGGQARNNELISKAINDKLESKNLSYEDVISLTEAKVSNGEYHIVVMYVKNSNG